MRLPDKGDISELLPARINEVSLVDTSSDWIRGFGSQFAHATRADEWYLQCAY